MTNLCTICNGLIEAAADPDNSICFDCKKELENYYYEDDFCGDRNCDICRPHDDW